MLLMARNALVVLWKELFQKQVEITQKVCGKTNVQYALFASVTNAACGTVIHGLGHDGPKLGRYGVHFTAADSVHNSATMEVVLFGKDSEYPKQTYLNIQNAFHFCKKKTNNLIYVQNSYV